jgi:hypothetical protein
MVAKTVEIPGVGSYMVSYGRCVTITLCALFLSNCNAYIFITKFELFNTEFNCLNLGKFCIFMYILSFLIFMYIYFLFIATVICLLLINFILHMAYELFYILH